MIVTIKTRKNGNQLGKYLNAIGENESTRTLEIKGSAALNIEDAIFDFSMQTENTRRGKKGLMHGTINPEVGKDKEMTDEDWLLCADILEKKEGLTGQPRALQIHEKIGEDGILRKHLHVVWQREKEGKLIRDSHSKRQAASARNEMEKTLGHRLTYNSANVQQQITDLWNKSKDGAEFVKTAFAAGVKIARGKAANIFVAVDQQGIKQELARAIFGQKRPDVNKKMQPIAATLPDEKDIEGVWKNAKGEKAKAKEQRQQETEKAAIIAVKRERDQQPEGKSSLGFREGLQPGEGHTTPETTKPEQAADQPAKENPFQRMLRQKREKAERTQAAQAAERGFKANQQGVAEEPKQGEPVKETPFQKAAREAFNKPEQGKEKAKPKKETGQDITETDFQKRAREAFSRKTDDHDLGHEL